VNRKHWGELEFEEEEEEEEEEEGEEEGKDEDGTETPMTDTTGLSSVISGRALKPLCFGGGKSFCQVG
jgi:hypothetical protein